MKKWICATLLLAAVSWHEPRFVMAQDETASQANVQSAESAWTVHNVSFRGGVPAGPDNDLVATEGLSSMGRKAWPLVRRYVWLSTYAGDDLFAGYSQPLVDSGEDELEFHLLVDREEWAASEPAIRQEKMYTAQARFEARMSELNLKGSMRIVLTSR